MAYNNNASDNSNRNKINNNEDKIKHLMRELSSSKEEHKREHDHKAKHKGVVKPLHDSKINFPGKKDMPDTTVICEECERYFESTNYTRDETDSGSYMYMSMLEQIKLNSNLTDDDVDMIMSGYEALDILGKLTTYYHSMVNKLANGGGKKKSNNQRQKGHFGVSSGMFNGGRNY